MRKKKNSLVYSVEEARKILGIGRNAAYNAVNSGEIPSIRIGRMYRIPKAALDKVLAQKTTTPTAAPATREPVLKVPRPRAEPNVMVWLRISVPLNNKLARCAIERGITLSREIAERLERSVSGGSGEA